MQLEPAKRSNVHMRVAVHGPSGAGKSYSALQLAFGLTQKHIAIIDTEAGSASLYSHLGTFSVVNLEAPYSPERYVEAIELCKQSGVEVLIIDSLSHAWDGPGGVLEIHGRMPGNSFANWSKVKPRHNAMIQAIMNCGMHVIVTLRTKQDYIIHDKSGRMVPEKVGLKPIQMDGIDYEFTVAFEVGIDHKCKTSKDRTGLFTSLDPFTITTHTGKQLRSWCEVDKLTQRMDLNESLTQNFSSNGTTNY